MLTLVKCNLTGLTARLGGLFCVDKRVIGMVLVERGIKFDPATLTKSVFDEYIQRDQVIGTIKFQEVVDANVERAFKTIDVTGEDIPTTMGLKKWTATFYKGGRWQNELHKLEGSKRYSALFIFSDGSFLVKQLKDGMARGYDITLFNGIRNLTVGTDPAAITLMINLEPYEMEGWQGSSAEYISSDIDFVEMAPIEEVVINVPILTAGATTTKVQINRAGTDSPALGLVSKDNWKMYRNGVPEAITALNQLGEDYTFTHAALVTNDEISFRTEMTGHPVYILSSAYFVGKSLPKKVV